MLMFWFVIPVYLQFATFVAKNVFSRCFHPAVSAETVPIWGHIAEIFHQMNYVFKTQRNPVRKRAAFENRNGC